MNLRTCIVTNKKYTSRALLRFTVQDGVLLFDEYISTKNKFLKNIGRGGYVFRDEKLIMKLPKMKGKINYKLKIKNSFAIENTELEKAVKLLEITKNV